MKILLASAFILAMIGTVTAASRELIGAGLYGEELLDYLVENYKTGTTLGYDNARDKMYGEIDLKPGNQLSCVYSGYTITISNPSDPRPEVTAQNMNCEHTWPQSYGADSEPQRSDLNHLYPTHESVNSSRGNLPFGEIPDNETDVWWYNGDPYYSIPTVYIDLYSEKEADAPERFEVREDHKGNTARSIFYFFTMYQDDLVESFFLQQRDALRSWHNQDPADNTELSRTMAIAVYQDNKPNPFIIDSTLVRRIWYVDEPEPAYDIVINEIHYNPSAAQGDDSDYEFLELYNRESFAVDLIGYYFSSGIVHSFITETIMPTESYLVLSSNADFYPGSVQWNSGSLNNSGEFLKLSNADNQAADSLNYGINFPWPENANGQGPSLELNSPELDNALGENWSASMITGGTPGEENSIMQEPESITLTSPLGGETWYRAYDYPITWNSVNITGQIKIELLDADIIIDVLAAVTDDDGIWLWSVPGDLNEDDHYRIRISDAYDNVPADISGEFSVSEHQGGELEHVFFSEYIEGSSNNKAIEIFNASPVAIDLSDYQIWRANNGSTWEEGYIFPLQGIVQPGDVWVVCNAGAVYDIKAVSDSIGGEITYYNGNDALGLAKNIGSRTYELIDVIGLAGENPGTGWDVAGTLNATLDHTLVRKADVSSGNINWSESGGTDPENSEWLVYPLDIYQYLGDHDFDPGTQLDPPLNVRIFLADGQVNLTWNTVTGASRYRIYYSDDPDLSADSWTLLDIVNDSTEWNGLVSEAKMFFYIIAE